MKINWHREEGILVSDTGRFKIQKTISKTKLFNGYNSMGKPRYAKKIGYVLLVDGQEWGDHPSWECDNHGKRFDTGKMEVKVFHKASSAKTKAESLNTQIKL